jgi:hypothetical protein
MDGYIFIDAFRIGYNVGGRGFVHNEDAHTITFTVEGISSKFAEQTHLYLLADGLSIKRVTCRERDGDERVLPQAVAPTGESGFGMASLQMAYDCGIVNWNQPQTITLYLSGGSDGRFSLTLIAQDPSKLNQFIESAGQFLFGPITALVGLLGYTNTFATTYSRYLCTFDSEIGDYDKISSAETIKAVVLRPLLSALRGGFRM